MRASESAEASPGATFIMKSLILFEGTNTISILLVSVLFFVVFLSSLASLVVPQLMFTLTGPSPPLDRGISVTRLVHLGRTRSHIIWLCIC